MAEPATPIQAKTAGRSAKVGQESEKRKIAQTVAAPGPGIPDSSVQDAGFNQKAMAILSAAKDLFMEQGFGAVSMDQVARQAGVSKATVYAHFTSKEKLFTEMVFRACITKTNMVLPALDRDTDILAALEQVAQSIVDHLLSPEPMAVYRIIVAEGPRFPELPQAFFGSGPLPLTRKLSDFFIEANQLGLLDVPDPRLASDQMIWLVRGPLGIHRLFTIDLPPDCPTEESIIKGAAQMFHRTFAPRKG